MSLNATLNSQTYMSTVGTLTGALDNYDGYFGIPDQQPTVYEVGGFSPTPISADISVQRSQGFSL